MLLGVYFCLMNAVDNCSINEFTNSLILTTWHIIIKGVFFLVYNFTCMSFVDETFYIGNYLLSNQRLLGISII